MKKVNVKRILFIAVVCSCIISLNVASQTANRGLYVIWYSNKYELLDVPYIVGGQIAVQWGTIDIGEGRYDFSSIENELRKLKQLGKRTTIQINGNNKPAWLFTKVPYYPGKLGEQVRDKQGTLMYWHPVHLRAYTDMLRAFTDFLAQSADKEVVIGIRLNFNAVGTEHFTIPPDARDLNKWIVPDGVTQGPPWSAELATTYQNTVVDTYVNYLSTYTRIFVRNSVKPEIEEKYRTWFETGKLAWFHTSSEAEPHSSSTEIQYKRFYDYCRSGKTVGYAEPWASAWGDHGGLTDDRWCSPPQWNYWRLLLDLHCGVSFIALYSSDLTVAVKGTYPNKYDETRDKLGYQKEFQEAFLFADKYVGYHASPEISPGAWVAFRDNDTILADNLKVPLNARKLSVFTGDYSFLMERLPDNTKGEHNVGPDNQRFGAWGRVLPAGESMQLNTNEVFASSLKGGTVLVTYLDKTNAKGNTFVIKAGSEQKSIELKNSNRWLTVSLELKKAPLMKEAKGSHIMIKAGTEPLRLHMVEVLRK